MQSTIDAPLETFPFIVHPGPLLVICCLFVDEVDTASATLLKRALLANGE